MLSDEGLHLPRPTAHCPVGRERCNFSHAFDHAAAKAGHLFFSGLLISSPSAHLWSDCHSKIEPGFCLQRDASVQNASAKFTGSG